MVSLLVWLGLSNFSSTLKVDRKGLSIAKVEHGQFNDYVSVDGQVVPISVVQISSEERKWWMRVPMWARATSS